MNEKVETQNVDKICPLFGSKWFPVTGKLAGVSGQTLLGGQMQLVPCQKERCQLWIKHQEICSIRHQAMGTASIYLELEGIKICLRDIFDNLGKIGDG